MVTIQCSPRRRAAAHFIDLPMLETIKDQLLQVAREHGDEDLAATATYLASTPKQPVSRG